MGDSVPKHAGPISLTDTPLEPSISRTRPTTTGTRCPPELVGCELLNAGRSTRMSALGGNMKTKRIVLSVALCFVAAAVCFAADAFTGTWKLNEAKSKLAGGPKNDLVVYEAASDNVKITVDGTDSDGKPTNGRESSTAKTTRSQAIQVQTLGCTRRSTIIHWRLATRRTAKLPSLVA
jgi:hypothetical protein